MLFPELAAVVQPLSGEYAGRRVALEQLPFVQGYGVDLGLMIDMTSRFGIEALAQTDLGVRVHRNRPLDELAPQAAQVLMTALARAAPGLVDSPARSGPARPRGPRRLGRRTPAPRQGPRLPPIGLSGAAPKFLPNRSTLGLGVRRK